MNDVAGGCSLVLKAGRKWRLVSSKGRENEIVVIGIDLYGGSLSNENAAIQRRFSSVEEAVDYLLLYDFEEVLELKLRCVALLGYIVVGLEGLLLVATGIQETGTFPGCPAHPVFTVTASEWVSIPLLQPLAVFHTEEEEVAGLRPSDIGGRSLTGTVIGDQLRQEELLRQELKGMNVNGTHYFCSTMDLTKCWTHGHCNARLPNSGHWAGISPEFTWNSFLSDPFAQLGLRDICPVLLRGTCISWTIRCTSSDAYDDAEGMQVTYLTRQRNTHAGPRYCCRGLGMSNGVVGAANDFECELLVFAPIWRDSLPCADAAEYIWSHVVWERGSVPVKWRSSITSVVERISVSPDPYGLTREYWQQLWDRHGTRAFCCVDLLRTTTTSEGAIVGSQSRSASPEPDAPLLSPSASTPQQTTAAAAAGRQEQPSNPYFALPFLGTTMKSRFVPPPEGALSSPTTEGSEGASTHPIKAEELLHRHFQHSLLVLPEEQHGVTLRHFDWHAECSRSGHASSVARLWALLADKLCEYNVSSGSLSVQRGCEPDVRSDALQRGVMRFNCKDCLDRTNLATFFVGMQVLLRQLDCVSAGCKEALSGYGGHAVPIRDGTWTALAATSLDAAVQRFPKHALQDFACAFLEAGDTISLLYANSPASHSGLLRSFAGRKAAGRCAFAIGLERHFHAITSQKDRQVLTDVWLGRSSLQAIRSQPGHQMSSEVAARSVLLLCCHCRDSAWAWRVAHCCGAVNRIARYSDEAGIKLCAMEDQVRSMVLVVFLEVADAEAMLRRWSQERSSGVVALRLSSPSFAEVQQQVVRQHLALAQPPAAPQTAVGWFLSRIFHWHRQRG